jgi:hypothetical protein
MQNIINFLNANPWLNLIFLILAIVSIIVSVSLYFRSRKEKILVYMTKSFNLIHNSVVRIPGLSIKYEDNNIDNFTLTKVAFWNKGRGTISNIDIAPMDRVGIYPKEDVAILSAAITYKTRDSNNFSLEKLQNGIIVNFDYIDFHQGVIIDVYHTGQDIDSFIIKGTVKGGYDLRAGDIYENYLLDKFITPINNMIPWPRNFVLNLLVAFILGLIIILPVMLFSAIDVIYKMMNKLPVEFDLTNRANNKK